MYFHLPLICLSYVLGIFFSIKFVVCFIPFLFFKRFAWILFLCFLLSSFRCQIFFQNYDNLLLKLKSGTRSSFDIPITHAISHKGPHKFFVPAFGYSFLFFFTDKLPKIGDHINVHGSFRFFENSRNPGQFDAFHYHRNQGILGSFFVHEFEVNSTFLPNPFSLLSSYFRSVLLDLFSKNLQAPYDSLLFGLLFGDRGIALPSELESLYRRVGLMHILVVSGAQVSLLAQSLIFILSFFFRPYFRFIILCFFLILFYCLCGGGASLMRASILCFLSYFFKLWGRSFSLPHMFCLLLFIMLLLNPLSIYDLGFQFSFLATFALFFCVEPFESRLPFFTRLSQLLSMAIVPTLLTAPLLAYHFHVFSFLPFLSNFFFLSLIEFLVLFSFFLSIFSLFLPFLFSFYHYFLKFILNLFHQSLFFLDQFKFLTFSIPDFSIYVLVLIYILIFLIFICFRLFLMITCFLFICFFSHGFLNTRVFPMRLDLIFFDVGQGDAALIRTSRGFTILVDAGPMPLYSQKGFDAGKHVLLPALRYLGISKIDMFILSHPDLDHYGGLLSLLPEMSVKLFVSNFKDLPKALYQNLKKHHIPIKFLNEDVSLNLANDVFLDFYLPDNIDISKNNASLTLLLNAFGQRIFFSGDIEEEREMALLENSSLKNLFLLKVPHHGSLTSSHDEFLMHTSPDLAFFSVGKGNFFSHPHPDVVANYEQLGSLNFRTDQDGALILSLDSKQIEFKSWLSSKKGLHSK